MEQIKLHIARATANDCSHQPNSAHDLRELVHRNADVIDLSCDRAVIGIVGITESAPKGVSSVYRDCIIGSNTQRLGLSSGHPIDVRSANRVNQCGGYRTASA